MIKPNTYPKCIRSFLEFYQKDKQLTSKYVNNLLRVKPFDVTLRDGLQSLSPDEQNHYTTDLKKLIYDEIIHKYNPNNLEIGSCVNTKILPIFKDTEDLFNNIKDNKNKYILVPNQEKLIAAFQMGFTNFSFITSVSDSFQLKNTKMTKYENINSLKNMMSILKSTNKNNDYKVKLYISCIHECPIEGKLCVTDIISHILKLKNLNFDKICLSDTCGTLTKSDFINIMNYLLKIQIDVKILSLHLHVKPDREDEVEKIVHTAIDYGIEEFDVSDLKTGGCSVTMDKNKLAPNMSYEQYYKFLTNYLLNK